MKLSLSWLESYFITQPQWDKVFDKLTMAGIEVEGIEPVTPPFSGVVVGQVIKCEKHPSADKLSLCMVDVGTGELLQIICGATNVKVGIKVPCALVDAVLPDGLVIAKREMRGLTSFGMLCSGNEIATPDGVDGLLILPCDAPIGIPVREYLGLDDQIVEFKITPNRSDCLSVIGLLREIRALTGYEICEFEDLMPSPIIDTQVQIKMDAINECSNYTALVIEGINNNVKLPKYMLQRLSNSGVRSISAVVDITNYVMLELGQPLHAFDLAKVGLQLQVRMARDNETIKLLDGRDVTLSKNTLLICDSKNQASAIAGVMGGFNSGFSVDSTDLVLESAFFTPNTIAGIAKQYGVNSDSAYRYERGVDPLLPIMAQLYASNLIVKYCGGKVGSITQVMAKTAVKPAITLKYADINKLIGIEIAEVNQILTKLGFSLEYSSSEISVVPPSYRFDIAIKEDIVEEVARVYGYDNIPPIMPIVTYTLSAPDKVQLTVNRVKDSLVNFGYNEIISYAFIEEKYEEILGNLSVKVVKLLNPIAGLNVMRTSLFADLIKALLNNLNRGHKNIKLFELARVFYGEEVEVQPLKLAGLVYGNYQQSGWTNSKSYVDFFDIKHDIDILLGGVTDVKYEAVTDSDIFHSGRCSVIKTDKWVIGIVGQLHPRLGQSLGLVELPYLFELDFASMVNITGFGKIKELSKFQKVERDLAFILPEFIVVGDIISAIKASTNITYLVGTSVFDIYRGVNLESGYKSVAVNFVFQGQKTLTDEEISCSMREIVNLVTSKFPAQLR